MFKTNKEVFRYFNTTFLHFKIKEFTKKVIENLSEQEEKEQLGKTNTSAKKKWDLENSAIITIHVVFNEQTCAGKCSTGNTLLGVNRYKAPTSSKSCTKDSLSDSTVTRELILEVLDTPELIDTNRTAEELRNTVLNCMTMTNPGPHAFLLILKMKHVTDQEKRALYTWQKLFS